MKRSLLILAALGLLFGYSACERQSWEKTREMHLEHHADHADQDAHDEGKKEAAKH